MKVINFFLIIIISSIGAYWIDYNIYKNSLDLIYFMASVMVSVCLYLCGSIPFALIITRYRTKQDIRKIGSGNIGATNVWRTGDKTAAFLTLMGDLLKGFLPLLIAKLYITNFPDEFFIIPVLGHIFPYFLNFKGGKGVATGFGCLLAFNPLISLVVLVIWLLALKICKISSLSALISFTALIIINIVLGKNDIWIFCMVAMLFITHKQNIIRLIKKQEKE